MYLNMVKATKETNKQKTLSSRILDPGKISRCIKSEGELYPRELTSTRSALQEMPKEVLLAEENNCNSGSTEDLRSVRNEKYLNKYIRL